MFQIACLRNIKKTMIPAISLFLLPATGFCGGLYFGGSIGQADSGSGSVSDIPYSSYYIDNVSSETIDTKDTAHSIFTGYEFEFTDFSLAIEGGYMDFGENTLSAQGRDIWSPDETRTIDFNAEADAIVLSFLTSKEVVKNLNVFGRLGINYWDISGTFRSQTYDSSNNLTGSSTLTASDDGTDLYFGMGLEYRFIRFGFDRYDFDDAETDYLYVGVKF